MPKPDGWIAAEGYVPNSVGAFGLENPVFSYATRASDYSVTLTSSTQTVTVSTTVNLPDWVRAVEVVAQSGGYVTLSSLSSNANVGQLYVSVLAKVGAGSTTVYTNIAEQGAWLSTTSTIDLPYAAQAVLTARFAPTTSTSLILYFAISETYNFDREPIWDYGAIVVGRKTT